MAGAFSFCISVLVLFLLQIFFAESRDCSDMDSILNCNECIRCGGNWCNKPSPTGIRCSSEAIEDWCPGSNDTILIVNDSIPGKLLSTVYTETVAKVGNPTRVSIVYKSTLQQKVDVSFVNTSQNFDFKWTPPKTECNDVNCTTTIESMPGTEFCSSTGRVKETVNLRVNINGMKEDTIIKYHVPCACGCSEQTEKKSKSCNGNGDLSCGVCFCQNGWSGEFCDRKTEKKCDAMRGDLQCMNPAKSDVECSGNGYCGPCETCECYTDRIGSQYFDKDNYCSDICMSANYCDECLRRNFPGNCDECEYPMIFEQYNQTKMNDKDDMDRLIWVRCNETLPDGCHVQYAARRGRKGDIRIMMIAFCDATADELESGSLNITVPVVLGVIAVLAVAAAAAGFMMYKNRAPPLPLNDPAYQNIGAEDCTGENPLYKPPTSNYKNPTYGKW